MKPRIIVTGTARSGTLFLSRLLNRIGIKASHERVYHYGLDPDGSDHPAIREAWKNYDIEVSWQAVPFLAHEPETSIIWHQLRDPLKVVRCMVSHSMLDDPRAFAFGLVKKVHPEVWDAPDALSKAVRHVYKWHELIELQNRRLPILAYRIEELNPEKLKRLLRSSGIDYSLLRGELIEEAFTSTPQNTNACVDHIELDWKDILKCMYGPELRSLARMWGYPTC